LPGALSFCGPPAGTGGRPLAVAALLPARIRAASPALVKKVALSVGGRLGVTISPRFGVETSVSYVPSSLRFTFDDTETKTDANLMLGTVRATFHDIPITSPVWLSFNGGVSMIRRGGEAYAEAEDKSDVGGVVGATVGFRLGTMLSFYVAAEDYIYGSRWVADHRLPHAPRGQPAGRVTFSWQEF
jgi:hypothetical protein